MRRPKRITVGEILEEPRSGRKVLCCRVIVEDSEDRYIVEAVKEDGVWVAESMWIGDQLIIHGGHRGGRGRRYALAGPVERAVNEKEASLAR